MISTIVFAHPWHGSFSKAVLDAVISIYEGSGRSYTVIDLHKEGFDPCLSEADLELFYEGKSADPKVQAYQDILKASDELVFIFPVWWYDTPAILKGFLDKVFLHGFAYVEAPPNDEGKTVIGNMDWIKNTFVFTSSASPTSDLISFFGNPIETVFIKATLKAVGIENAQWVNICDDDIKNSEKQKMHFSKIAELLKK